MAHLLPAEADLSQLFGQLSADLAQAQSLDEAAKSCVQLLQTALTPRSCQLVWASGQVRLLSASGSVSLAQPDDRDLMLLSAGRLAPQT